MSSEHHPSSEQVENVVKVFEQIVEREGKNQRVYMLEGHVHTEEKGYCNTIACHGGHFALQVWLNEGRDIHLRILGTILGDRELVEDFGFGDGKRQMAEMLGLLGGGYAVASYYYDYPELWGNGHGWSMFVDAEAFGRANNELKLKHILKHWRGVLQRTKLREKGLARRGGK